MKNMPSTSNLAVFVVFFGIALVEAIQRGSWIQAALFIALGLLSLRTDFSAKK